MTGLRAGAGQTDHIWAPYVQAAIGKSGMEEIIYGDGTWTNERLVEATRRMVDLSDQGFMDLDGLGLDYTECLGRLNEGKNAIWASGVWALAAIGDVVGVENFGFMTVPPWDESVPLGYPGGIGEAYGIASSSPHADLAAEYFDFVFNQDNVRTWIETLGVFPPVKADVTQYNLTPQQIKMVHMGQQPDGIGYWLFHFIPPDLRDYFLQAGGGLMGGHLEPEDFLEEMQKGWEQGIAQGDIPR